VKITPTTATRPVGVRPILRSARFHASPIDAKDVASRMRSTREATATPAPRAEDDAAPLLRLKILIY